MKKFLLLLVVALFSFVGTAQENVAELQRVLRVTVPAPGIELELPVSSNSTILMTSLIGGSFIYDFHERNLLYQLYPSVRLSYRHFYNFQSRLSRGRRVAGNSGNFLAVDFITTFEDIYSTDGLPPKDYFTFNIIPQWGIQRAFGIFHLACSVGPGLYFDTEGWYDFSWFNVSIRLGFDLARW